MSATLLAYGAGAAAAALLVLGMVGALCVAGELLYRLVGGHRRRMARVRRGVL